MDKKSTRGITMMAWSFILLSIGLSAFIFFEQFQYTIKGKELSKSYLFSQDTLSALGLTIGIYILFFGLICGFGLLKLREWARKMSIGIVCFVSIPILLSVISCLKSILSGGKTTEINPSPIWLMPLSFVAILIIYYLTRPKVKRAFSERNPATRDEGDV